MATIVKVYELEGNDVKHIYLFVGNLKIKKTENIGPKGKDLLTQKEINDKIPYTIVNNYIHLDDQVSTVKYKITSALKNRVSVQELYLFLEQKRYLNPRTIYNELTQNNTFPITGERFCSFLNNLYFRRRFNCLKEIIEKDIYEYEDILNIIDASQETKIIIPIGLKYLIKRNYPFIVNPFDCAIEDTKISEKGDKYIQTDESNLLFKYGMNISTIYMCRATDVLRKNDKVSQEYLIKLYYPYLYQEKILSLDSLLENQPNLLDKNNKELSSSNFDVYNEKVNLFYEMYYGKKNNLDYLSKGITNIRFTIHPYNTDIFPIEILFKLIHSTEFIPFIKYNPGNRRENIYRLYTGDNIATNGKKIPILYTEYGNKKNKLKLLSKTLATKKRVAFYISILVQKYKQHLICEFSDKGDIFLNISFNNPVTIEYIEKLVRDAINEPILKKIYNFLAQSGYEYIYFDNLTDKNIEINNITYNWSIVHNKKINLNKYSSCVSSIFTINKGIIKTLDDVIFLNYKRVSNYKKMDALHAFISDNLREGQTTSAIVKEVVLQFSKTEKEAALLVAEWMSEAQVLVDAFENKKIFKNSPGLPVFISSAKILTDSVYKQSSIIRAENINNIEYIYFLNIYIDSLMRLIIEKNSTIVTVAKINRLCSFGKAKETIDTPNIMADVEKSLVEKLEESPLGIRAYTGEEKDEDEEEEEEDDIDNLFGMVDDDDEDSGELEFGEELQPLTLLESQSSESPLVSAKTGKHQENKSPLLEGVKEEKKISPSEVSKPESEATSDMDIDWSGFSVSGVKNIFMKRLTDHDAPLFLKKKQGKFKAYTRACPWQYRRQPVVLSDIDKAYIDRKDAEFGIKSYDEYITYGSGPKKNHYICPRFWCLQDEHGKQRSITASEINEGKCGGWDALIPEKAKKIPKGKRIFQFTDERFHREESKNTGDNPLVYKPAYPGYIGPSKHPQNLCIPCCYWSPRVTIDDRGEEWIKKRGYDWREGKNKKKWIFFWENKETKEKQVSAPPGFMDLMYKGNPVPTYEKDKNGKIIIDSIKGVKQKRMAASSRGAGGKRQEYYEKCDVKKDIGEKKKDEDKSLDEAPINSFPLKQNQLGYLSLGVQRFLSFNNDSCKISRLSDSRLKAGVECLLRKGVSHSKRQSFLAVIGDVYWYIKDAHTEITEKLSQDKVETIEGVKRQILQRISIDVFITLQNGTLVELFKTSDQVNINKYSKSILFSRIKNKKDRVYFEKVVSAYENFIKYIQDPTIKINYEYLWDFICMPEIMGGDNDCCGLFPEGLNLVILKEPDDDVIDKIELICPTNHYASQLFDINKPILILFTKYGYFEPIYRITRRTDQKYTIKKLFKYDEMLRTAPELKKILTIIYKKFINNCGPLPSLPHTYTFSSNLQLNESMRLLADSSLKIGKLVINFNSRVIGILVKPPEKNIDWIYVPCAPSALLLDKDIETIFAYEVAGETCEKTLYVLNEVKKLGIPSEPMQLVVNDGLMVGIVTETNQFVPINPESYQDSPCGMKGNKFNLRILKTSSKNLLELDSEMLTSNEQDEERIEVVKKIKLESNFYNMFRNFLRIILLNFENRNLKNEILQLVSDPTVLYMEKLERIEKMLHILLDDYVDFVQYKIKSLMDIKEIMNCLSLDKKECGKTINCIFSDSSCKLLIPRINLVSGDHNEHIYFGRVADELVRYPRIRDFILKPKSFLSFSTINYNLKDDEIILLEQLLLEKYFADIILVQENPYIKTKDIYELVNPDKTVKYPMNYILNDELQIKEQTDCIIIDPANKIHTGKQGSFSGAGLFWRNLGLTENFKLKEFYTRPDCSWDIIKVIYTDYTNKDISIDELRKILISVYEQKYREYGKILIDILKSLNYKNRFHHSDRRIRDFGEVIKEQDYYLSFLDLLFLIGELKLPCGIISRISLPSFNKLHSGTGHSRKSIIMNNSGKKEIYLLFGSRWKQIPLLPVYSLFSYDNNFKIPINKIPHVYQEVDKNRTTITAYLDEQRQWRIKSKPATKHKVKIKKRKIKVKIR